MINSDELKALFTPAQGVKGESEDPFLWWMFWRDISRWDQEVSMYEHFIFGIISRAKPVVRFDHPEKKLVESVFSKKLLGEEWEK